MPLTEAGRKRISEARKAYIAKHGCGVPSVLPDWWKQRISKGRKGKKGSFGHAGKRHSAESRNKIKIARAKQVFTEADNAKRAASLLRAWRDPSNADAVALRKNRFRLLMSGENSPTWKGGKSFETYPKEFSNNLKERVRDRDCRKCQECGAEENNLHDASGRKYRLMVHHIDYDKKNCDTRNLISLCRPCHTATNHSRDKWKAKYQKIMQDTENANQKV